MSETNKNPIPCETDCKAAPCEAERGAGPLAAYRAALAKVEPGEAFLARTRQALAEAGRLAEKSAGAPRENAPGQAEPDGRTGHPVLGRNDAGSRAGQDATDAPRRGWRPAVLRIPRRSLLPAACLALLLLAVPAGALLNGRAGGASLSSGGAAAQAADEQMMVMSSAAVAEDTTAEESAPTVDYTASAGEPAAAETAPVPDAVDPTLADPGDTPDTGRYSGGGQDAGTDGAAPAGDAPDGRQDANGAAPASNDAAGGEAGSPHRETETAFPAGGGTDGRDAPAGAEEVRKDADTDSEPAIGGVSGGLPAGMNKLPAGWAFGNASNARAA